MMRALYAGVSGLKTHQVKMDVIGNNIANVNTTSYKSSSITFSALLSQTTQSASGPDAARGTGGTNARQIGLGVKTGAINTAIASQGASQSTGNPFDIMINGSSFFVVNNGSENYFTRDGSFYVDAAGNLAMTSTGYNVMGWGIDENTQQIKKDSVTALRIMNTANMTYPPEATTQANVAGIMDRNDKDVTSASGKPVNLDFYDALGYKYTAKFAFKQSSNVDNYSIELTSIIDSMGKELDISQVKFGVNSTQENPKTISFNSAGYKWNGNKLETAAGDEVASLDDMFSGSPAVLEPLDKVIGTAPDEYTVQEGLDAIAAAHGYEGATDEFLNLYTDPAVATDPKVSILAMLGDGSIPRLDGTVGNTSFETQGRFYTGTTIDYDPKNGSFAGIGGVVNQEGATLGISGLGGNFQDIFIDFSKSFSADKKGTSTLGATSGTYDGLGAGRRIGDMNRISVQDDGQIIASYNNGMTRLLGQIAVADFANASGLEKQGDNLYSATLNSGEFDGIGVDVKSANGYMTTGQLEMSNVDLSSEFTEMITTQRGFQANSRIITVSDTILEELTNLKR